MATRRTTPTRFRPRKPSGLDRSPFAGFKDPILHNHLARQVSDAINTSSMRALWMRGSSGESVQPDDRRNYDDEFGWPTAPSAELYRRMYDFDSLSARAIEYPVKECWQEAPSVTENKDEDSHGPFDQFIREELVQQLRGEESLFKTDDKGNPLWWYCQLVDALSRTGAYGILLYGLDDGLDLSLPVEGIEIEGSLETEIDRSDKKTVKRNNLYTLNKGDRFPRYSLKTNAEPDPQKLSRKLLFLRAFPESQAMITRWENNPRSTRYCQPTMYQVKMIDPAGSFSGFGLPMGTMNVHWTRVVHVADVHHHAVSSETLAAPALQSILADVLDGRKVSGSSSEGYWQSVIIKLFLSTHPQLGGDVDVDEDNLRDMLEEMRETSKREGFLYGMDPKPVAPTAADPTPFYDLKVGRVATRIGTPRRKLEGSERGELASSQDDDTDSDRISQRQETYLSPRLVAPVVDRLISVGVCPKPKQFYVVWPPTGSVNKIEQSQILAARTTAMAGYVSGNVASLMPEREYLVHEMGFDEDTADEILKAAEEKALEQEKLDQQVIDEHGMVPNPPEGFQHPDPEPDPMAPIKVKEGEKLVDPSKVVGNVFCPTGPGGGVDPSCSPGSGGGSSSDGSSGGSSPITRESTTAPPPATKGNPVHDPDVDHDSNGDGVTDTSRVGVPASHVPPPPAIGRLPNLTPHERAVEKSFIEHYENNPDQVANDFRDVVYQGTKPGEPPTFGTDDAKVLADAWSHPDIETRAQNRATLNLALHQTANAIAKRAFVQHLDTLKPGDQVMVTVGGCGAGKGYALKNVPQALDMKSQSKAVWDSAGDQNATENPWIQKEAESRGLKVNYVYVHADPRTQWAHPERGVVKRAGDPNDGRMVDAKVFADSYAIGAKNHQAFFDSHKDNPSAKFVFLENSGKPKLLPGIPKEALGIDRRELADFAIKTVKEGDAPPRVKRGGTIGERIWTKN